jgi:hypothetical protein
VADPPACPCPAVASHRYGSPDRPTESRARIGCRSHDEQGARPRQRPSPRAWAFGRQAAWQQSRAWRRAQAWAKSLASRRPPSFPPASVSMTSTREARSAAEPDSACRRRRPGQPCPASTMRRQR